MRLAFFSPFNPQSSGISDYSEELLPYLARYADIDLFFDGPTPTNQNMIEQFTIYPMADFPALRRTRRYDTCLYQMGNSRYHTAIYLTLRRYPGITILHEYMLHHFLLDLAMRREDWSFYWRELAYHTSPELMKKVSPKRPAFPPGLPLARRVIELSLGVIVHNQDMVSRVLADAPQARAVVAPMGMPLPSQPASDKEQMRTSRGRLNLPIAAYLVGIFGHLSPHKRIEVILGAFARLRQQHPEAMCLIVGQNTGDYNLPALLEALDLAPDSVIITGFVASTVLADYIQAADVWVNLRYPVHGETSAAALRLMAYGKPVIVSDVTTFASFPDEVCIRVKVNASEIEFLYHALLLLAQHPDLRRQLGRNARRYIEMHHSLNEAAEKVATGINHILAAVQTGNREVKYG